MCFHLFVLLILEFVCVICCFCCIWHFHSYFLCLSEHLAPFPGLLPAYLFPAWLPALGPPHGLAPRFLANAQVGSRVFADSRVGCRVLVRLPGFRLAPGLAPGFWPGFRVGSRVLARLPGWLPGWLLGLEGQILKIWVLSSDLWPNCILCNFFCF